MMDAAEQIRAEMAAESRSRVRRSALWLVLLLALGAGLGVGLGVKQDLGPQDLLAAALAVGFILLGASISGNPALRFGRAAAAGLAVVAFLSPLVAATEWGGLAGASMLGCAISLLGLGLVSLLATRLTLGATRRRFGGATQLQGVAAALTAAFGVGLHCPMGSAVHLATHAVAALLVGAVLSRTVLR